MVKVLFVCMGNICRSPTAHGVFEHLVQNQGLASQIHIDSAGTHAYHVGEAPDGRSQKEAGGRGIDLSYIRARKVEDQDFEEYDYILAMDEDNFYNLNRSCPPEHKHKLQLFLEYAKHPSGIKEVPDPYYGGAKGFAHVFDLVEMASQGLMEHIKQKHAIA